MNINKKEYQDFLKWKKDREYGEFLEWKKKQPKKAYKPEPGETYYYIELDGTIKFTRWSGDADKWFGRLDLALYTLGNCFKTQEEAEFMVEKLKVTAELQRFAEEHNDHIDWNDPAQKKWNMTYDYCAKNIETFFYCSLNDGLVYFTSEEIIKQAIKTIGEDRIKKYYLGVGTDERNRK